MTRRKVRLFAAMFSLMALAFSGAASAGEPTDVIKAKQATLSELLKQDNAANATKIDAVVDTMLDYKALAKASLGNEWAGRSEAQRAEFSDLLKQLVRKAYEGDLRKRLNFNIEYLGEKANGDVMIVRTKAVSRTDAREEPVEIAYKLAKKDGAWRVQDIVTEGVSLVASYRSQFTKILKNDGFPALIKKMKDRLAKGDAEN